MDQGGKKRKKLLKSRAKKIAGKTARIVGCAGVGVVGLVVDVPAVCSIAVAKTPAFLWKGWKQHVINMELFVDDGSCSRAACLPLTAAMLVLWPARVAASLASALMYSLEKGLYGAVVAYREKSIRCGLKHVIAAIAEYDELSNDVIHLREGTCLPKPVYSHRGIEAEEQDHDKSDRHPIAEVTREVDLSKLFEFMSSIPGREECSRLLEQGLLVASDKLTVDSAALTILSFLVSSTNDGNGETGNDEGNGTFASLYDPLETLQRQVLDAVPDAREKQYLQDLVLCRRTELQELLPDPIRAATLQAFGRRIRGISAFLSMNPEFRRQYGLFVHAAKALVAKALVDRDHPLEDMISFD